MDFAALPSNAAPPIAVFPRISDRDSVAIAVCRTVRLGDRPGGDRRIMAVASGSGNFFQSDKGLAGITGVGAAISRGITGQFYRLGIGSHEP